MPRGISRRSQRHTARSLTTLIVQKLAPPGNLASVYTDHMACELYDHSCQSLRYFINLFLHHAFFFWIFSSTLIEDQSPTDWKKRLQVRHSDLSQTLVVLNSGRGDGSWHSGYADWKNISSRPNQKRLWMCTTCVHYNSSKAACSQCGLRRSWAEVVKGV